jgi:retron-type reverse transcriptase
MQRHGDLWQELIGFPHLLRCARKAQRGKRFRPATALFNFNLEHELWKLHQELQDKTYQPGPYRTFHVHEPKKRLISAAPYRDRIVHHALTSILEPIYERSFISDSYACRKGRGTHAAVRRCQEFARRWPWVLKADIQKYFPSIDLPILKALLARRIKDPHVLWLAGLLIDASNPQEEVQDWFPGDDLFVPAERRRGLPIGNQTSQFFANVYLDPLDHFVKDRLGIRGYVRYVDDFVVFAEDKSRLGDVQAQVAEFLLQLRLRLHATKNVIFPVRNGIRFLGYRVFPTHRLLVKENVRRFRRRLKHMQRGYAIDNLSFNDDIYPRIISWIGHARQADTYHLRERLFDQYTFERATTE